MCDTMGAILGNGHALFAKNSDRSPNEPQVLEYYCARDTGSATVKATYVEIDQVPHTYATLLSRPVWMWGAEMGVNEHGVCIGNEAVFTKGSYGKTGLTGMDLLRLALERSATAQEARDVIIELLERYGQGGDCGYDKSFFYDNSFLIMDMNELYILETAGKHWVYKSMERGSISNRLAMGDDGDVYSSGAPYDFAKKHREPVYSFFSGSEHRLEQTTDCLTKPPTVATMMEGLRTHNHDKNPMTMPSISSTCMHAGGLIGDHTTASMIVELKEGKIVVWATGSSTPCISLFKPWLFGNPPVAPVFTTNEREALAYWLRCEVFHRKKIGTLCSNQFYEDRDDLEAEWLRLAENASPEEMNQLSVDVVEQEEEFYDYWSAGRANDRYGHKRFLRYWDSKTEKLNIPEKPAIWV